MTTETIESAAAPAVTPEPPKPQVLVEQIPPDALKPRLEAAKATGRAELLRELGVSDPDQLKTALASIAAAAEAKKSDAEKLATHLAELERTRASLTDATTAVASVWATESAKLTAEQLAAVDELAGNSVTAKVRALNVLRKTWAAAPAAQAPVAPTAQAPTAPIQTPASTAPTGGAPAPTGTSQTDHKAVYEQLSKTNPVQAARYLNAHEREIFPA